MRNQSWKSIVTSRWAILGLVVILLFLVRMQYIQWQKRREVTKEIEGIKKQEADWQSKNKELEDSLAYLNTASYKEHVAREQLNLKKDGEIVMSDAGTAERAENNQQTDASVASTDTPTNNIELWWKYFFKR